MALENKHDTFLDRAEHYVLRLALLSLLVLGLCKVVIPEIKDVYNSVFDNHMSPSTTLIRK
jgi:hypothetical protein